MLNEDIENPFTKILKNQNRNNSTIIFMFVIFFYFSISILFTLYSLQEGLFSNKHKKTWAFI